MTIALDYTLQQVQFFTSCLKSRNKKLKIINILSLCNVHTHGLLHLSPSLGLGALLQWRQQKQRRRYMVIRSLIMLIRQPLYVPDMSRSKRLHFNKHFNSFIQSSVSFYIQTNISTILIPINACTYNYDCIILPEVMTFELCRQLSAYHQHCLPPYPEVVSVEHHTAVDTLERTWCRLPPCQEKWTLFGKKKESQSIQRFIDYRYFQSSIQTQRTS